MATGDSSATRPSVGLLEVVQQWGRIGCTGFGGPPTHIALLRGLCVDRRHWLDSSEFEDAVAACNLLPGPASTQLAILCAWTVAGPMGAVVGGRRRSSFRGSWSSWVSRRCSSPRRRPSWCSARPPARGRRSPRWRCTRAPVSSPASWRRARAHVRWIGYALAGASPRPRSDRCWSWFSWAAERSSSGSGSSGRAGRLGMHAGPFPLLVTVAASSGGVLALVWVAFKVGALSYGGGFVIIPLMQHDAVQHYHWMTDSQFLGAVALGQITPGPVVQTVAVVGYAAAGIGGGVLAAAIAFSPSFVFVLAGGRHFQALRRNGGRARSSTARVRLRSGRSSVPRSPLPSRWVRRGSSWCSAARRSRCSPSAAAWSSPCSPRRWSADSSFTSAHRCPERRGRNCLHASRIFARLSAVDGGGIPAAGPCGR